MGEERAVARIGAAVGELDWVIRELRGYVFGLRPEPASRRLDETLHELAAELEERTGIAAAATADRGAAQSLHSHAPGVPGLAREALSHMGRQSGAATCGLGLVRDGSHVVLEIGDDGKGLDPGAAHEGGGPRAP